MRFLRLFLHFPHRRVVSISCDSHPLGRYLLRTSACTCDALHELLVVSQKIIDVNTALFSSNLARAHSL
eukprot:m.349694 g.349694  ORF g.349694 m.349694 type:complete len:69 (+) comp16577_c0_seq3:335-541(+)